MALRDALSGRKELPQFKDKRKIPYANNKNHPAKFGRNFEEEIKDVCEVYQDLKIAYIQQFLVPRLFVKGQVIYTKKTGFDFIGATVEPKNGLFIECKTTGDGDIPVYQDKVGIKQHQIDTMLWLQSVGFNCMFLWKVRSVSMVYKITPQKLIEMTTGKKRLTIIDCDDFHIPRIMKVRYGKDEFYDFLGKLEDANPALFGD